MKVKTLFVAPYASMKNLIEECFEEESDIEMEIRIGNLQEGVAAAKNAGMEGFDVIISRGGTAKLIGEAIDLPVIDVHVSGYDMLRVFTLANDFPRKKAIVGFPAITLGAKAIIDLLEIPVDIFTIEDEEETEPLLQKLKQDGYELILGDVVTFDTASKLGLLGILIQSGREAIFDAFKEAKTVSRWMVKNKREVERLKAILAATTTDFIVFSESSEVVFEQWENFTSNPIIEMPFDLNAAGNKEQTHVIDHNGLPYKITMKKITLDDGHCCFFNQITKMEISPELIENLNIQVQSAPHIVHRSKAMSSCLEIIQRSLSFNQFILFGKKGAGNESIAQYIHYHKYHGSGLFASIPSSKFLAMDVRRLDKDIKSIYLHTIEQLDNHQGKEFLRKLNTLKDFTVILAMTEEQPGWGNILYEEETIRIPIPSLSERKEDLRELVSSFLAHYHQTLGTSAIKLKEDGLELLEKYEWPGYVKELKALLKDAVLMEKGYVIEKTTIEKLMSRKKGTEIQTEWLSGSLDEIEKKIIEHVLQEEDYNQTKAAKRLNINRSTLWRKLKQE